MVKTVQPDYSFGFRRIESTNFLVNKTATNTNVGPGRYSPELTRDPSTKMTSPKINFTKAPQSPMAPKVVDKHQTYDTRSSLGCQ